MSLVPQVAKKVSYYYKKLKLWQGYGSDETPVNECELIQHSHK